MSDWKSALLSALTGRTFGLDKDPTGLLPNLGAQARAYDPAADQNASRKAAFGLGGPMAAVLSDYVPVVNTANALEDFRHAEGWKDKATAGFGLLGMPITAYHGSPHDFEKFSMDKIGTGEGAQAYGHGLYFAEHENVARQYRDALKDFNADRTAIERLSQRYRNPEVSGLATTPAKIRRAAYELVPDEGPFWDTLTDDDWSQIGPYALGYGRGEDAGDDVARYINERFPEKLPGHMYEVNIDAEPEDFLDWDKPLSEQSEKIRAALLGDNGVVPDFRREESVAAYLDPHVNDDYEGLTGGEFHSTLGRLAENDLLPANGPGVGPALDAGQSKAAIAPFLRNEGIPGIRYLDQGSRGAGEGSRNYVVFDENLIKIARKYGLPMSVLGGAGMMGSTYGTNE